MAWSSRSDPQVASTTDRHPPTRGGQLIRRAARFVGQRDLSGFVFLLFVFASVWLSVEVTDAVEQSGFVDRLLLVALRTRSDPGDPVGPGWLEDMVRDFTALGAPGPLVFLILSVVGYFALTGRTRNALLTAVATGGGAFLSFSLKELFARPRPTLVPHGVVVSSASFPSGHSMMSAATYLTLAALLCRVDANQLGRAYILMCAVVLTVVVGFSRVYLGVHWPTDVVAGWTFGAAWAVLCWIVARGLQRRGVVEPRAGARQE